MYFAEDDLYPIGASHPKFLGFPRPFPGNWVLDPFGQLSDNNFTDSGAPKRPWSIG